MNVLKIIIVVVVSSRCGLLSAFWDSNVVGSGKTGGVELKEADMSVWSKTRAMSWILSEPLRVLLGCGTQYFLHAKSALRAVGWTFTSTWSEGSMRLKYQIMSPLGGSRGRQLGMHA